MLKPGWSQRQYQKVKSDLHQLPEWVKRSVMAPNVSSDKPDHAEAPRTPKRPQEREQRTDRNSEK